jgi:hypothetical protein
MPAGSKHPAHLAKRGDVVVKVFDHIKRRDQVKGPIPERQRRGLAQPNISQAALDAVPNRFFIDIHALRLSERGEMDEHRSGPTTNVEDPPLVCGPLTEVSVEDLQQDPSPAHEPPVDVFHPAVLGVVLALQISLEPQSICTAKLSHSTVIG